MIKTSKNPFSDLSREELKEMVEFCRKMFVRPECDLCNELPVPQHVIHGDSEQVYKTGEWEGQEWEWKRGDWFWHESGVFVVGQGEIPKDNSIPLPLAHQWEAMKGIWSNDYYIKTGWNGTMIGDFILDENDCIPLPHTLHKNPHFARYMAVRRNVEKPKGPVK